MVIYYISCTLLLIPKHPVYACFANLVWCNLKKWASCGDETSEKPHGYITMSGPHVGTYTLMHMDPIQYNSVYDYCTNIRQCNAVVPVSHIVVMFFLGGGCITISKFKRLFIDGPMIWCCFFPVPNWFDHLGMEVLISHWGILMQFQENSDSKLGKVVWWQLFWLFVVVHCDLVWPMKMLNWICAFCWPPKFQIGRWT